MIPFDEMIPAVVKGLKEYLGIKLIRGNQTAPAPEYPYGVFNITTPAGANGGTWQQHADGKDRLMVKSIWSWSFLSGDADESLFYATKAREWFEHSGRAWLSEHGFSVQSTSDVTNRDNILTVEYERKNGFDVVFYAYSEAESLTTINGYIEKAEISHETMN